MAENEEGLICRRALFVLHVSSERAVSNFRHAKPEGDYGLEITVFRSPHDSASASRLGQDAKQNAPGMNRGR